MLVQKSVGKIYFLTMFIKKLAIAIKKAAIIT